MTNDSTKHFFGAVAVAGCLFITACVIMMFVGDSTSFVKIDKDCYIKIHVDRSWGSGHTTRTTYCKVSK